MVIGLFFVALFLSPLLFLALLIIFNAAYGGFSPRGILLTSKRRVFGWPARVTGAIYFVVGLCCILVSLMMMLSFFFPFII